MKRKTITIMLISILAMILTASTLTTAWYQNNGDGTYTFGINLTEQQTSRVMTAYTQIYGYEPTICDPDCHQNPESAPQFVDRMIKDQIKYTVLKYERDEYIKAMQLDEFPT